MKNIFGNKTSKEVEETYLNWTPLISVDEIKTIKEISKRQAILIFKHSTRCGISRMVMNQFVDAFNLDANLFKLITI
mgnify:CR=1 FL=1